MTERRILTGRPVQNVAYYGEGYEQYSIPGIPELIIGKHGTIQLEETPFADGRVVRSRYFRVEQGQESLLVDRLSH